MIPIIAILFAGGASSSAVGIGAILGAPFMLSTLAMFVTGVAVLLVARRNRPNDDMPVNVRVLGHECASSRRRTRSPSALPSCPPISCGRGGSSRWRCC